MKVLHSICQQVWKTQQWPQDWKRSVFISIPKKGNAKECSNYRTIVLISMLKYSKMHSLSYEKLIIHNFISLHFLIKILLKSFYSLDPGGINTFFHCIFTFNNYFWKELSLKKKSQDFSFSSFFFYFILLYNTVLVLSYINMNSPQMYLSSQS